MIDLALLIFSPLLAWERIVTTRRSVGLILATYLLPLLALLCLGEGYGLVHWGRARPFIHEPYKFPVGEAVVFESAHFLLLVAAVLISAQLLQTMGSTFHGRHTFTQALTTVAYGLGPLFLVRLLNTYPPLPAWALFGVGLILSVRALYSGLPRVMEPDPPTAFGLFLIGVGMIAVIMGLVRFLSLYYILGKLKEVEALFLSLSGHGT